MNKPVIFDDSYIKEDLSAWQERVKEAHNKIHNKNEKVHFIKFF